MKNSILIVIDYQNDFVAPNGKIAKKIGNKILQKSQAIAKNIQLLVDKFHASNRQVLFLMSDYSLKNYQGSLKKHKSQSDYGEVAVKNTWGHELYKIKANKKDKFIIKSFFDGFYKSQLESYLNSEKIKDIYICGINTDFCVFHTAIGAMNRGYEVSVIEESTETITKNKKLFLDYLKIYAGVKIINLKKLIRQTD